MFNSFLINSAKALGLNEFAINFAQTMAENVLIWQGVQSTMRRKLYSWKSIGGYIVAGLLGFIPGKREREYNLELHCWFAIIIFISAILTNISLKNKEYQNEIKKTLFPKLLKVFSDNIWHSNHIQISRNIYNETKLFQEQIDRTEGDDFISGTYKGVDFKIAETTLYTIRKPNSSKKEKCYLQPCQFVVRCIWWRMWILHNLP